MLDIICFSKDRPLQLCGYLESLYHFAKIPISVTIIAQASSPEMHAAYTEVAADFPSACFRYEGDIEALVRQSLKETHSRNIMFGCDDVVFCAPFDKEPIEFLSGNDDAFCFSLRLGRHIIFSHPADRSERMPHAVVYGNVYRWHWPSASVDFGYPFELNATIYRRDDVNEYIDLLPSGRFHPNLLEHSFYQGFNESTAFRRPFMAAYQRARAVVVTVNRVQDIARNHIYAEWSPALLLELYREGKRLDVEYYSKALFDRVHIGKLKLK